MNGQKIFEYYEKVYFHELGRKEQIFSRLSIPLATIIAVAGFYSVIIGGDRAAMDFNSKFLFSLFLTVSIGFLGVGVYFFIDALLGKMDQNMPEPNVIEQYRIDLLTYYGDEPDPEARVAKEMHNYYHEKYMLCATICTNNNDRKSSSLYYCNLALIVSALVAVVAYAIITIPKL